MNKKLNTIDVLLGLQWGDEGKGKIIDYLTPNYDIVARFNGGPNAGHTIFFDGKEFKLHVIPSGIFSNCHNFIGAGVALDPIGFIKELAEIKKVSIELQSKITLAREIKLIIPTHRFLDGFEESCRSIKLGTTKSGIGPVFKDHVGRDGLTLGMYFKDEENFKEKYFSLKKLHLNATASLGTSFTATDRMKIEVEEEKFFEALSQIKKEGFPVVSCFSYIQEHLEHGMRILAEGAQATLLDINSGSYPFVTSSVTTTAGVCTGLQVSPKQIGKVIGVTKAYCTRVGAGPFPTELGGKKSEEWCAVTKIADELAAYPNPSIDDRDPFVQGIALRRIAKEYGATTGRLRRTGYLDMLALKYAITINGVTELVITKCDILDCFDTVKIATSYSFKDDIDFDPQNLDICVPSYTHFSGWKTMIQHAPHKRAVPDNFRDIMNFIEERSGVPVTLLSIGPNREHILEWNKVS